MAALGFDRRGRPRLRTVGADELSAPLAPAGKLRLAVEIYIAYCHVRWWLRRHDVAEVVRRLRAWQPARSADGCPACDVAHAYGAGVRLGRAVIRALQLLPTDSRCLMRSLVLTGLLARRGIASSLIIGVRTDPAFAAHAWVEHAGEPLLPAGDKGLGRLTEI